jgi:drug/metabolite transporter (DMT)-like permease
MKLISTIFSSLPDCGSATGFSLQTLIVKRLGESGFHGSFQVIIARGMIQLMLSGLILAYSRIIKKTNTKVFGPNNKTRILLFLRGVIGYGGIAFAFLAVEKLPLGDATVLVMLAPFFSAILAALILGEPWLMAEFFGTIIALAGAVCIVRPPFLFPASSESEHTKAADPTGVFFALVSSIASGGAYITVRMLGTTSKMPWGNIVFAQAVAQVVLAVPSIPISGQTFDVNLSPSQYGWITLGGCIGAASQTAMTIGMQREKSARATAMRMSDVLFGFVWQAFFTSDAISHISIVGALLVAVSVLIIACSKDKTAAKKEDSREVKDADEKGSVAVEEKARLLSTGSDSLSPRGAQQGEFGVIDIGSRK